MAEKTPLYLSYVEEDRPQTENLYDRLVEAGFRPWMFSRDVAAGTKWPYGVRAAIENAHYYLPCLSLNWLAKWEVKEPRIWHAHELWSHLNPSLSRVVPIHIGECNPPPEYQHLQRVYPFEKSGWLMLMRLIRKAPAVGTPAKDQATPSKTEGLTRKRDRNVVKSTSAAFAITFRSGNLGGKSAIVMVSDSNTSLGAIVDLLVYRWNLDVWEGCPIGYDLQDPHSGKSLGDLSRLRPIDVAERLHNPLKLAPVKGKLVVNDSTADIPAFEVSNEDGDLKFTLLASADTVSAGDVIEAAEEAFGLPSQINRDPVYYELHCGPKPGLLPRHGILADQGLQPGAELLLVLRHGVCLIQEPFISQAVDSPSEAGALEDSHPSLVPPADASPPPFHVALLNSMDRGLGESDLGEVLFGLELESDQFIGSKRSKMISLILYCRRRNIMHQLLAEIFRVNLHIRQQLMAGGYEASL